MIEAMPGDRALVTDAACAIGAIYAHRLAARGFDLVLAAPDPWRLKGFARWIRANGGGSVETIAADPTDRRGVARLEERIRLDPALTMLVNSSAGAARLEAGGNGQAAALISLNQAGPARLAYKAGIAFAARGEGTIVNLGSASSDLIDDLFLAALSDTLNGELGGNGVQAQAVLPRASARSLWGLAGAAVERVPRETLMLAEAMVDQALAGLDAGEPVTRPASPRADGYHAFEPSAARGRWGG